METSGPRSAIRATREPAEHDDLHAPERPGEVGECQEANIAVVVDDLGHEVLMTAAQYRTQEFARIRALELWEEVRFLQPTEIHPDDFSWSGSPVRPAGVPPMESGLWPRCTAPCRGRMQNKEGDHP